MKCSKCSGEEPKIKKTGCCTPSVLQIESKEAPVLFHRIDVPASLGDDVANPPIQGQYKNILLVYEANNHAYLYNSDGIYTFITGQKGDRGTLDFDEIVNRPMYAGQPMTSETHIPELPRVIHPYNTVADMKVDIRLADGDFVITYGFYAKGDGGSAKYKVREITNQDAIDEMTIVALADENLVAELILDSHVNLRQFGAKGDGSHDDTPNLKKAIMTLRAFPVSSGKISDIRVLEIPEGNYKITETVDLSTMVKIKSIGMAVFSCYVEDGSAFRIIYQTGDIYQDSSSTLSKVRDWNQGYLINGECGIIVRNASGSTNNVGLEVGNTENLDASTKGFMFGKIFGITIYDFGVQLKINANNVYCDTFEKMILATNISLDNVSIQFGDYDHMGLRNSGERITFKDSQIGHLVYYASIPANFECCSFDFLNYIISSPTNAGYLNLQFSDCHFEAISYTTTDQDITDGKPYGIVSNTHPWSMFTFDRCKFVLTNYYKIFSLGNATITANSNRYIVRMNDCTLQYGPQHGTNISMSPKNAYICDPNVDITNFHPHWYLENIANFTSPRLNLLPNPNFDDQELGSLTLTRGQEFSSYTLTWWEGINGASAEVITNNQDGKKSLKLKNTATTCNITIDTDMFDVNPGDRFIANFWFKGFTSLSIRFYFYDVDGNEIEHTSGDVYTPTSPVVDEYFMSGRVKQVRTPARAKRAKIKYQLESTTTPIGSEIIIGGFFAERV